MESLAFLGLLGLGLLGWYGLMKWNRDNAWWMRAAAVLCFFGLTGAGRWMPAVMRGEPSQAQPSQAERSGAERAAKPSGAERLADDRARNARYEAVVAEIGPPPAPEAVPVLGYVTASGVAYGSHWRMPPNADTSDNLKQGGE